MDTPKIVPIRPRRRQSDAERAAEQETADRFFGIGTAPIAVVPAPPGDTIVELWVLDGAVRKSAHRVIGWAVDERGNAAPIGTMGRIAEQSDQQGHRFVYREPDGRVIELPHRYQYASMVEAEMDIMQWAKAGEQPPPWAVPGTE